MIIPSPKELIETRRRDERRRQITASIAQRDALLVRFLTRDFTPGCVISLDLTLSPWRCEYAYCDDQEHVDSLVDDIRKSLACAGWSVSAVGYRRRWWRVGRIDITVHCFP